MSLSTKQKHAHRHREQTCGCQGGSGRGGMDWEFGISTVLRTNKQQSPTVQHR